MLAVRLSQLPFISFKTFSSNEVKWKSLSHVRLFVTPWFIQSMKFSRSEYWSLSLFQGIFPTQGTKPGLQHWRQILYQLSHKGSTRLLEWVAYPFSSGSSWPRNWMTVSCIAGRFFTNWAMREAQLSSKNDLKKKKNLIKYLTILNFGKDVVLTHFMRRNEFL